MARTTLLAVTLLLLVSMAFAARTEPADPSKFHTEHPGQGIPGGNEGCEGVGEEECLVRRTLNAHVDYIYTQEKGN